MVFSHFNESKGFNSRALLAQEMQMAVFNAENDVKKFI